MSEDYEEHPRWKHRVEDGIDSIYDAIEYLPTKWFHYVCDLADAKAYRDDPEWKRIEDLRNELSGDGPNKLISDGEGRLTVDSYFWQMRKSGELTPSVDFWRKVLHASEKPRGWESRIRRATQRARRGWDDRWLWEFRSQHAELLSQVFAEMKPHGYPARMTPEEWNSILQDLAERFEQIRRNDDGDQKFIEETFAKLAEVYLDLWD